MRCIAKKPRSQRELESLKAAMREALDLPEYFEFVDRSYAIEQTKCLTILEYSIHYYTGDAMLYVRIEWVGVLDKRPYVEYKTLTLAEVKELYSSK